MTLQKSATEPKLKPITGFLYTVADFFDELVCFEFKRNFY